MRAKFGFCLFIGSLLFFGSFASSQIVVAEPSFSLEFGSFGTGDGKFKSPSGLAIDTGNNLLYVADTNNHRIQIIDLDGNCSGSEELADEIIFLLDGEVRFKGSLEELLKHENETTLERAIAELMNQEV